MCDVPHFRNNVEIDCARVKERGAHKQSLDPESWTWKQRDYSGLLQSHVLTSFLRSGFARKYTLLNESYSFTRGVVHCLCARISQKIEVSHEVVKFRNA